MTRHTSSNESAQSRNEMDRWIESAAKSVGYEDGFGIEGCDLTESQWWLAYVRQSTEDQKGNNRLPEYLRTCAEEAKRLGVTVPREYILYDIVTGEHLERPGMVHLPRIHRRTGMDDVRTAEGGEGVTGVMIRARIWVDGRLAGGLQALLGAPMAAYSGCGEPDGGIGHGKRRSRTGLARVCGDVGLAGGSVADGLRQAGSGMARSRARARLNCSSQGQRRGSCRVNRRAERVIRPAKAKTRRLRVLVVTIC